MGSEALWETEGRMKKSRLLKKTNQINNKQQRWWSQGLMTTEGTKLEVPQGHGGARPAIPVTWETEAGGLLEDSENPNAWAGKMAQWRRLLSSMPGSPRPLSRKPCWKESLTPESCPPSPHEHSDAAAHTGGTHGSWYCLKKQPA